jgi:glutathione S-transferase
LQTLLQLTIADILVYVNFWWFSSGILDHVPTTVLDSYPKLKVCRGRPGSASLRMG